MNNSGRKRAVFLDRDGVLNAHVFRDGKAYPPFSWSEFRLLDGVMEALQLLTDAGFLLIVVTNQPDVARGIQSRIDVEEIHSSLLGVLPLNDIFTCFHDDQDACQCRKPQPGLIRLATEKHSIELSSSFLVGDRWKDIEAGQRAGCKTIWIEGGVYQEQQPTPPPDLTVLSLLEAVPWMIRRSGKGEGAR